MKGIMKYYLLGFLMILFSVPLGRSSLHLIYSNKNLIGEYSIMLEGYIHSYMLIGILLVIVGLLTMCVGHFIERDNK